MKKLMVLAFAALLLVAFSVPVMAEVKIGGIVFTDFYYLNRNDHSYGGPLQMTTIQVPNITRLYARWTNEDNVGMYIELGLGQGQGTPIQGSSDDEKSAVVRHAYGWWDVNPMFQIMAGHSTTPFSPLNPSQLLGTRSGTANIIGVGYGDFYSGRFAQVRGTFNFSKMFSLAIALVDPNGSMLSIGQYVPAGQVEYTTNTKLPRVDAGARINLGPVAIIPSLLWQQRTVDKITPGGYDDSLTTIVGSLDLKFGMGPFTLEAEGNYGQNWGNTRGLIGASSAARAANASAFDGNLDNTKTFSYWLDLGFKLGPATPHLIFGSMNSKGDKNPTDATSMMWGVSCPIQLAKGFSVRPEMMWYYDGDDNTDSANQKVDNGSYQIFGVQFQITF